KSIHDNYNAGRFEVDANNLLTELFKKHEIVVMTGGSMLYIDAVCTGMDDFPTADLTIRQQLREKWENEGLESIQNMLKELDPDHYAKVDLQNPKRILKALEVSLQTGIPYSKHLTGTAKNRDYDILKIGLNRNRDELYNRINLRVDAMLAEGLEAEARSVHEFKQLNSLNTVGYKQFFDYFDGITDYQTAVELIKRDSRRYARRQLSWFNRDKAIIWFEPQQISEIINTINDCNTTK
ncbi:MAG TPA: tRNA (adenosine(37)-N6)-dimethylallyltransferase MiaA, partial [Bacteroidales bacterium]|nr:tRNA (adenosine(37)-N6)-dimethylallyltransferase MiaA [Bacteroidales bacterium]